MSAAKHTPGPWMVHNDPRDGWPLVMAGGSAGRIVANVNPESCPNATSAPALVQMPAEANARLIAAAPELLEALQTMSSVFFDYSGSHSAVEEKAMEKASAAIDKATGAQQ